MQKFSIILYSLVPLNIGQETKPYRILDPTYSFHHTLAGLLKGTHDKAVVRTARDIIASMKRDWIQV